ncbi:MAG: sugar ABC transporter permease [Spirochaetaceae bacterium]|jgi:raffinose/stachyose/melibiose transport system permease protein|nr:sugar ABC transporter permease [Spirochaetaceae bacterium]
MIKIRENIKQKGLALAFMGPTVFFFVLIIGFPFISGIFYSFTEWNGVNAKPLWVGLQNFKQIFLNDSQFFESFWFTLRFTITTLILTNVLAYIFALILIQPIKSKGVLRTVFFLPNVIGGVLLGFIWRFILVNGFSTIGDITHLGLFSLPWLGTPETGFWGIVIVYTWRSVGYLMIIYIAHFLNIDSQLLEAAHMDGASGFRMFRSIILPLSMSAITICLFLVLSWTFKSFDIVLSLTSGGPFRSTETVALNIYLEAFSYSNFGVGSAKSLIYFIVVGFISLFQVGFTKKMEVEA